MEKIKPNMTEIHCNVCLYKIILAIFNKILPLSDDSEHQKCLFHVQPEGTHQAQLAN